MPTVSTWIGSLAFESIELGRVDGVDDEFDDEDAEGGAAACGDREGDDVRRENDERLIALSATMLAAESAGGRG